MRPLERKKAAAKRRLLRLIMRSGGAVSIACAFKSGVALEKAIIGMLDEVKRLGGDAGVIAVTRKANIATLYNSEGMKRASVSTRQKLTVATFAQ